MIGTHRTLLATIALMAHCSGIFAQAADGGFMLEVTAEDLEKMVAPDGIEASVVSAHGAPGIQLTNHRAVPVSVTILEYPMTLMDERRIVYRADVSSRDLAGPAYLEMHAVLDGEAYFSRALDDAFSGTQSIRTSETPFYLSGRRPVEALRLGVRFGGPGTMTLSNLRVQEVASTAGSPRVGMWVGIAGATMGILTSLWFSGAQRLVARGRGRKFVMAITLLVSFAGLALIVVGVGLAAAGASFWTWYPLVLMGAIAMIVYASNYIGLRRHYRQLDTHTRTALDLT